MTTTEITSKEKYDRLREAARSEDGVTRELLNEIGSRHSERGTDEWWSVYFNDYALIGAPNEKWNIVHAEDGEEVTAELSGLDLRSALRRMRSSHMPTRPDWM